MESEYNPSKRHYDITMSKRTRKPLTNLAEADRSHVSSIAGSSKQESINSDEDRGSPPKVDGEEEESDRKSLKQLINGDGGDHLESRVRSSLGHHFTEEEMQLQLVKKQQPDGGHGVKFRGLMCRYVKVLSHLVKVKREPRIGSRKNHVLRLTM